MMAALCPIATCTATSVSDRTRLARVRIVAAVVVEEGLRARRVVDYVLGDQPVVMRALDREGEERQADAHEEAGERDDPETVTQRTRDIRSDALPALPRPVPATGQAALRSRSLPPHVCPPTQQTREPALAGSRQSGRLDLNQRPLGPQPSALLEFRGWALIVLGLAMRFQCRRVSPTFPQIGTPIGTLAEARRPTGRVGRQSSFGSSSKRMASPKLSASAEKGLKTAKQSSPSTADGYSRPAAPSSRSDRPTD